MMSHSDVMIICSIFPVGKPLHTCISTAMVCLQMHWHPHWNPLLLQKLQTSLSILQPPFHACDTLPQVFQCTLILEFNLLHPSNTGISKDN